MKSLLDSDGRRKLKSWIQTFIERTEALHSPVIFRKWTAISTIAATVEQKVWVMTSEPLHPNMYVFIIGRPGSGKTRAIRAGRRYIATLQDVHLTPVSVTWASLTDCLTEAKKSFTNSGGTQEYNSVYICTGELGAFMSKYSNDMVEGLAALYDIDPYGQRRRTGSLDFNVESPQVNLLAGATPSNLLELMPEKAWGQGFAARLIMVFSDEIIIEDDFDPNKAKLWSDDLMHDLVVINGLHGQFHVTEEWRKAVMNWRTLGCIPVPNHPKLLHYLTRRHTHLYKLSMISSIDRDCGLALTRDDFNQAMGWLLEAEAAMPDIFKAGASNADGQAIDEINHFIIVSDRGEGVSEQRITHFARERVPLHSILRIVEVMERSGMIHCVRREKRTGMRYFSPTHKHE